MILFYVWVIYPLIKNNYSCQEKFLGWHFDIAFIPITIRFLTCSWNFCSQLQSQHCNRKKDSLIFKNLGKANINMRKKNVLIVFGTRPEAIKMAP